MVVAVTRKSLRSVARAMATMWGSQASKHAKVDPSQLQPMIFPYTLTAQVIQFDWVFFLKQCWWPRYWVYASIACYPLWIYIHHKGKLIAGSEG